MYATQTGHTMSVIPKPRSVIPAKAGIQCRCFYERRRKQRRWIPDRGRG